MHELALTRSLVGLVDQEAKKQSFKRALEIRLKVGAYSGVVPDYILDLFPHVSEGTPCEGAALFFETVPARFRCADCGYEGEVERKMRLRGRGRTQKRPLSRMLRHRPHHDGRPGVLCGQPQGRITT